jgi:SpoVK/Ycf46/Vps4 family AAA+-type ATPase
MMVGTAELQSQIPGEMERNIINMFEQAKKKNAVLLLDECDSLLSSRELVGVVMGAEINTLLTQLERYDGVVILTTNRISRLDAALARRIISKIEVLPPTQTAQIEIWKKLVPSKMPLAKDVKLAALAKKYDMTGGEIKNAILLAARTAIASGNEAVTMEDFEFGAISSLHAKDDFLNSDDIEFIGRKSDKKRDTFLDNRCI